MVSQDLPEQISLLLLFNMPGSRISASLAKRGKKDASGMEMYKLLK